MSDSPTFGAPVAISPDVHKQGFGQVSYGADDALNVRFYYRSCEIPYQSQAQGRPIYEQKVYVEITAPSDGPTKSMLDREATDEDKRRFHKHWSAFQAGNERPAFGTPLETWPQLDVAAVATMKHHGVHTIEQLAALSDVQIHALQPHGFTWRQQAQAMLAAAKDNAFLTAQAAENADMRKRIEELEAVIRSGGIQAPAPKRRKYTRKAKPQDGPAVDAAAA